MKNELLNKLKNFNGFHPSFLYHDLIVLEKQSDFDEIEWKKFLISYSLISAKSTSPKQMIEYWSKLDRVDANHMNRLSNSMKSDWIAVAYPDNQKVSEKVKYIKIYLSIDNGSLHRFANQFLLLCLENGYFDFDFKLNGDEEINRRDSVVIYCTDKNFGQYVNLIQEVIKNHSEIVFNSPHLLGIPYNEYISCGVDFNDGKTSYTEKLCNDIFEALKDGKSPEEIVDSIDIFCLKHASCMYAIKDMSSNVNQK